MFGTCGPRHRSFQTVTPLAVHVVVDGQLGAADLDRLAVVAGALAVPDVTLEPDQLELVRLAREFGARLVLGHDPAHEALAGADDAIHLLLDGLQVFGGERGLDVEVVVEAVGDRAGRCRASPRG